MKTIRTMESIADRLRRNAAEYKNTIPAARGTADGVHQAGRPGHWTDGFWPAMLLLMYSYQQAPDLLVMNKAYEDFLLERVSNDPQVNKKRGYLDLDHDIGFIFHLSSVYRYLLTGESLSRDIGLRAASMLRDRFSEKGGFLVAWNAWEGDSEASKEEKKGKVIIDSLMNVPLLLWSAYETKDDSFAEIAVRHLRTVLRYMVRDDFSTHHTYNFNPATGEPIGGRTVQGYSDDSCWSRGQSWAIYGFALAGRYTGESEFVDAAVNCARYWESRLLPGGDAPWDFDAPREEGLPIDTSAMAITACGYLQLAELTSDERFKEQAVRILRRLEEAHLSALPHANALVLHGCSGPAYRKGSREERDRQYVHANQSLIFGDYFYLEALVRINKPDALLPWSIQENDGGMII